MAAIRESSRLGRRRVFLVPALVFVAIASALLLFWQQNINLERNRHAAEARIIAEQLRRRVEDWVDARTAIMSHIAGRLEAEGIETGRFRERASQAIEWFPGFRAMNWVDDTGRIVMTVPNEGNEGALGKNLFDHPNPGVVAAITKAEHGKLTRSPVTDLLQGGKGVAVYHPVIRDQRIAGYINGVLRIDDLASLWISDPELLAEFSLSLREADGVTISLTEPSSSPDTWPGLARVKVWVVDKQWTLTIAPSPGHIGRPWGGTNPALLLATGLMLAAGICFLLGQSLYRQGRLRRRETRSRHLLDWATRLHRADSYKQISEITLDEVREQCGYDRIWALVLPKEASAGWQLVFDQKAVLKSGDHPAGELRSEDFALSDTLPANEQVEVIEDAQNDSRVGELFIKCTGLRSLVRVSTFTVDRCPVVFGTGTLGVQGCGPPASAEVEYLSAMANHVAEAISRVRFQQQRQLDAEHRALIERRMFESQKMESLGMLAGGIAHDFNNLLVAILGNADLAREDHDAGQPIAVFLDQIVEASHRAADLCRQMLTYSGGGHRELSTMDLNEVVRDMANLLEVSISKGATLEQRYAEDLPFVGGDITQLRQVVMNLVTNASDALGEGTGTIQIETGSIFLDQHACEEFGVSEELLEQEFLLLRVSDNGCGMDRRTRARIFDPFFTTKSSGHGLGLAAVQGIVRSHQGALHVKSDLGQGTTVTVFFPRSLDPLSSSVPHLPSPEESASPSGGILVIDDEANVRGVARAMLEKSGYQVLEAVDGPSGLALFREKQEQIDLLLIDMTMPGMRGDQVLEQARRIDPQIHAIISSGYGEQLATRDLQSSGISAFIAKPYTRADLLAKVTLALAAKAASRC